MKMTLRTLSVLSTLTLAAGCGSPPSDEEVSAETSSAITVTRGPSPCWLYDPISCVPAGTRLLIVGPSAHYTDMDRLRQHKNATGMPAWVLTMDDMRKYAGKDDAERLKRVIARMHEQKGTWYVLLAGDASVVPVRRRHVHDPVANNESFNPSDLYYADLYHHVGARAGQFDDWDANGNGIFDEEVWADTAYANNPDDVDGWPEVAVGRVPAHTTEQLGRYVDKVIRYETGQTPTLPITKAGFVADAYYGGATSLLEGLEHSTFLNGSAWKYGVNYDANNPPPSGWANASMATIDSLSMTMPWIAYVGHGNSSLWGFGENGTYFDSWHVSGFTNANLPVVVAAACETGKFADNIFHAPPTFVPPDVYDAGSDLSMGGPWLFGSTSGGGAIAYFGETVVLPDSLPVELETYMLRAYGNGHRVLGDVYASGARDYWAQHQTDNYVFGHPRIYLGIMEMFADPSLRLR